MNLADEGETLVLGAALGRALAGDSLLITLDGPLGAGKTTLVRGVLRGQGYSDRVVSPTYTLMEVYPINGRELVHLDLYRIADPDELEFLGLRERLGESVVLLEWPERGRGWLPDPDLEVKLSLAGEGREAQLLARTAAAAGLLARLAADPACGALRLN